MPDDQADFRLGQLLPLPHDRGKRFVLAILAEQAQIIDVFEVTLKLQDVRVWLAFTEMEVDL